MIHYQRTNRTNDFPTFRSTREAEVLDQLNHSTPTSLRTHLKQLKYVFGRAANIALGPIHPAEISKVVNEPLLDQLDPVEFRSFKTICSSILSYH